MNLRALQVYADKRIVVVGLLGFSSGLPLALTYSTLQLWLATAGIQKSTIGVLTLVGLSYSLKPLWAPLFDHARIPILTRIFGRRRSWALLTQFALAISIYCLGQCDPKTSLALLSLFAVAVAFCSASQDIAIDAFRIELLEQQSQGAGAALYFTGYRIAMVLASAGPLYVASFFSWHVSYTLMALCMGVGVGTILWCDEPKARGTDALKPQRFAARMKYMVIDPFLDFMKTPHWSLILFFIIFYKLGDAFLGNMLNPFYVDMGFTLVEIASVTKIFGLAATLLGGFAGGILVYRFGMLRALLVCGVLQLLSNLIFIWVYYLGHSVPGLMIAISAENFAAGMAGVASVAYLSSLCSISFTATQYALLSSLASLPRTVFSSGAGFLAEATTWPVFFLVSTAFAIPAIVALLWLMGNTTRTNKNLSIESTL